MLVATITNNRKIGVSFCHPSGHRAKGKGLILETVPYRKTICELWEIGEKKEDNKFIVSATIRWGFERDRKFKKGHGPKELMRLDTLAKAIKKVNGSLTQEDRGLIFGAYLMRHLHGGGPFLNGSGSSNPMSESIKVVPKMLMTSIPDDMKPKYIM